MGVLCPAPEVGRCPSVVALGVAALIALTAGLQLSCASDPPAEPTVTTAAPIAVGDAPLRIELVRDAVAAVEAELGGPQRFFEVNATPTIVNLFVANADSTEAAAYVYVAATLEQAAPPQPARGPTFGSADIDFDETLVLAQVRSQLTTSDFRLFSITGVQAGGVQYRAVIDSAQGTEFVVFLTGTGAILGTEQNLVGGSS